MSAEDVQAQQAAHAAARRADTIRALTEERAGYVAAGKTDRVKAVDAELARMNAAPVGRTAPRKSSARRKD